MKNLIRINKQKGFSLIELVVVLALFMFIMGVAITIFVSMVRHQKKILSQVEMVSQTSYLQDYFSRSLKGAVVDVSGNCLNQEGISFAGRRYVLTHRNKETGFYQGIKFLSSENICQEFFLSDDGIFEEIKDNLLPQNFLSKKFQIQYARFILNGDKNIQSAGINFSPVRITFAFSIKDPIYEDNTSLIIQSTVSSK